MPELKNARHELFAQELAKGHSAAEAYRRAGYSNNRKSASQLQTKPTVQARKQELLAAAAERTGVTVDWIVDRLRENAERSMQHEPVCDTRGRKTGEYRYDGAVANKALELLGKHKGMFKENLNLTADQTLADLVMASMGLEKPKAAEKPEKA